MLSARASQMAALAPLYERRLAAWRDLRKLTLAAPAKKITITNP